MLEDKILANMKRAMAYAEKEMDEQEILFKTFFGILKKCSFPKGIYCYNRIKTCGIK